MYVCMYVCIYTYTLTQTYMYIYVYKRAFIRPLNSLRNTPRALNTKKSGRAQMRLQVHTQRQYLYFCTSKESKLSTGSRNADAAVREGEWEEGGEKARGDEKEREGIEEREERELSGSCANSASRSSARPTHLHTRTRTHTHTHTQTQKHINILIY